MNKMSRRILSSLLTLIFILNLVIPQPIFGDELSSYKNNGQQSQKEAIEISSQNEEHDTSQKLTEAMGRVDNNEYSQKDLETISEYNEIDPKVLKRLLSSELYAAQCIEIAKVANRYKINDKELDNYLNILKKSDNMDKEIHLAMTFNEKELQDKNGKEEIKNLILKGYSMDDIKPAFRIAEVLDINSEILIKKDKSKQYKIQTLMGDNRFNEKDKKLIERIIKRYNIDETALLGALYSKKTNIEQLTEQVASKEAYRGVSPGLLITANTTNNVTASFPSETKEPFSAYINPPFYYRKNMSEYIAPSNGALTYERTDLNIPGRNGLDLDITLKYNSARASMYRMMGFSGKKDFLNSYTPEERHYEIGGGWSFNFSYLDILQWEEYPRDVIVHLGNGEFYIASRSGTRPSNYTYDFEEYEAKDITLEFDSSYHYIESHYGYQSDSKFAVTYKDGTKEYFDDNGYLVAKMDRYGNTIKYDYEWEETYGEPLFDSDDYLVKRPLVTKITDSLGKIINIWYDVDSNGQREITIQAPGRMALCYTLLPVESGEYTVQKCRDFNYLYTNFTYEIKDAQFSFQGIDEPGATNRYLNLTKIEYPTGSYSSYAYEKIRGNMEDYGYKDYFRVKTRSDMIKSGTTFVENNKETYVYDKEMSGYPNQYYDNYPWNLPSDFTHSATIIDAFNNQKKLTFNYKHQKIKDELIENGTKKLKQVTYEYYLDRYPQKETTTYYGNGTSSRTAVINRIFDEYGDLLEETDELNRKTTYDYDSSYHILRQMTKNVDTGIVMQITNTIDGYGNITKTTKNHIENGASKPIVSDYRYDSYGNMTSETTAMGDGRTFQAIYEYSPTYQNALLTKKTTYAKDYSGVQQTIQETYTYDDTRRLISTSADAKGRITKYNYDYYDNIIKVTNPNVIKQDGTTETSSISISRDYTSNYVIVTDECGNKEKYQYDGIGRLLEKQIYNNGYITYERNKYDSASRIEWVERIKNGSTLYKTSYQYDGLGRVKKIMNNDGTFTTITYDDAANKITYTDEESNINEAYYNNAGKAIKEITYPNKADLTKKNTVEYQYNGLDQIRNITDPRTKITSYSYDDIGRLVSVTNAKQEITKYKYDNLDNLVEITNGENKSTKQKYDELCRLIIEERPDSSKEYFKYDEAGNLVWKKDRKNQEFAYRYDERNRLMEVKVGAKIIAKYEYYANGKLKWEENETGRRQYAYDVNGNLSSVTEADGKAISYQYDYLGNRTSMTDQFGATTSYGYDNMNRLNNINVGTVSTSYGYYSNGTLKNISYPGSTKEELTYDGAKNLTKLVNTTKNGSALITYNYDYTYDASGNQLSKLENGIKTDYIYDELNRIQKVKEQEIDIAAYTYDKTGNILTEDIVGVKISKAAESYKYDALNRLIEYTDESGNKTSYTYYPNGLRATKTSSGHTTKYYYDGNNAIIETVDGNLNARNIRGLNYIGRQDAAGQTSYYLYNGHGDVTSVIDGTGVIKGQYAYDIYGYIKSANETGISNPIRYAGQYYDGESGLYYLRARYYDPGIGRFISEDTYWHQGNMIYGNREYREGKIRIPDINAIRQSTNLYVYALNNPNMYIDSSGEIVGTVTGVLVGGIVGGISAAIQRKDIKTGIASGAVSGAIVGITADIIVATGGTGVIAVGALAGAGFVGSGTGNIIDQVGNEWKWGKGVKLSVAAKNINYKSALKSAVIGAASGALTGVTGQLLVAANKTSSGLYEFAILSGASSETVQATARAVITSNTMCYMYDTATGAIYTITANGIEYLTSIDK